LISGIILLIFGSGPVKGFAITLIIGIVTSFFSAVYVTRVVFEWMAKRNASKNLPASFDGLKIVQISDIHSGSFYNKAAVKRGVEMILKQQADIIFFTGDLVNNIATEVEDYIEVFGKLKAPMGVYSILGNHDYGDYAHWDSIEDKKNNLQ